MIYRSSGIAEGDYQMKVVNAANDDVALVNLTPTAAGEAHLVVLNWNCGAVGSQYRFRLISGIADPALIEFDNVVLGSDVNTVQISQATFFGGVTTPGMTNCFWTGGNTANVYTAYAADADCRERRDSLEQSRKRCRCSGFHCKGVPFRLEFRV